ncbi:MAG: hypothetical protein ACRDZ3_16760, partial [Acidimicrobiia bacterium]
MGERAAETVEEIEDLRSRIDGEVRELEQRLPAPARWTKQLVGIAAGGGVGGSVVWFAIRRLKARRQRPEPAARAAEAFPAAARILPPDVIDDLSRQITRIAETGAWRPWVGGIAALWLA